MHALDDVGVWLNLLSGSAIAALGIFVASIRPRTKANLAFVVFALAFGASFVAVNGGGLFLDLSDSVEVLPFALPVITLYLTATVGLVWFALVFPDPLPRSQLRLLLLSMVAVTPFLAYSVMVFLVMVGIPIIPVEAPSYAHPVSAALAFLAFRGMIAALIWVHALWALRFAVATEAASARHLALVAGAMVLYSGFWATLMEIQGFSVLWTDPWVAESVLASVAVLAGAGLWMWAMFKGPAPRAARNVMLLTLGMMLAGMLYGALDLGAGGYGLVRMSAVAVLTYGLVRHQLLGIDVKVRWTISKSTVAAVFVAVFFIASEAAQEFFGETLGSAYVGILAAGGLVFVIAPLSRLADRLAEKAVPTTVATAAAVDPHQEAIYRSAVQLVVKDRRLTRTEERELFRVARGLGLEAQRAHEILAEIEAREEASD